MSRNSENDHWLERARSGERAAFDALIRAAEPRVAAFVRSRLGRRADRRLSVEDVVQDTWVRAHASLPTCKGADYESFVSWLLGVARIALIRAARAPKGEVELSVEPAADRVSASRAMRREDRFDCLEHALQGLRDDQREVVYLARIEGLPMKQVATRMGRSTEAVKKLFYRALVELRQRMDDTGSLGLPDRSLGRSSNPHE